MRPVSLEQLSAAAAPSQRAGGGLLEVTWSPVALDGSDVGAESVRVWQDFDTDPDVDGADVVLWKLASDDGGVVGSVHGASHAALAVLQSWLAGEHSALLVVLTRGAVGLAGEDVSDLAGAAVWGLVRSAQAEHPGRLVVLDSDGSLDVRAVIGCNEPQLVVRSGVAYAARLAPANSPPTLRLPSRQPYGG